MSDRKFIVDNQEVKVSNSQIKNYYLYPESYLKNGSELLPFPGKLYVSEDGEFCSGSDCSIEMPSVLLNEQGKPLTYDGEDFNNEQVQGFIYDGKLYFIHQVEEVLY